MIEKEKAVRILKALIENKRSVLSTRFYSSHKKVAVLYGNHTIEIIGEDNKCLKYSNAIVPLTKKEYKELYSLFIEEVKKRKEESDLKRFNQLENDVNS